MRFYVTLENGYCNVIESKDSESAKKWSNSNFSLEEKKYQGCRASIATIATREEKSWVESMRN